jgi:twinkle protein
VELIPDDIPFEAYMQDTEQHRVLPASSFTKEVIELFYPTAATPKMPAPLWEKMRTRLQFRPGELTLWAGVNGHGKSMFTSQVALDLCYQAERVLSLSFEMPARQQMKRWNRQAWAGAMPPAERINEFARWTDNRLWIYDHMGDIEWKKVIAVMRYAREKFGITQFIVDSLTKCVRGEDDYNAQKDFVNGLTVFAHANEVHVHLVHHIRKGESEHKCPGKFDIKGASSITDLSHNIAIVWKNANPKTDEHNCVVDIVKQRNGEFEGKLGFWFDLDSNQYLEKAGQVPQRYSLRLA